MLEGLGERMVRAAKLDASLYEEVEADRKAQVQAAMAVVLSAMAAGVGATLHGGMRAFFLESFQALAGWYMWAFATCLVGMRLLPESQTKADFGELLRTISFSSAPGVIRVLGIIPGLTGFVFGAASVWMLGAMVIAVRQAFDYTTTSRAVAVCVIGWIAQILIFVLLLGLRGAGPAG